MRRSHRANERAQHGKHWDPIFFQRRCLDQVPLVEECREIFVNGVDQNESGQNDHEDNSGNNDENYVEDTDGEMEVFNAAVTIDGLHSSANTTAEFERYQGQEINDLFDDELSHMFLHDWDESISTWEAKVVRRFFSREDDETLLKADNTAWAWLDDRGYSTGHGRTYQSRMGAKDLCSALRREVFLALSLNTTC